MTFETGVYIYMIAIVVMLFIGFFLVALSPFFGASYAIIGSYMMYVSFVLWAVAFSFMLWAAR